MVTAKKWCFTVGALAALIEKDKVAKYEIKSHTQQQNNITVLLNDQFYFRVPFLFSVQFWPNDVAHAHTQSHFVHQ